MSIHPAAPRRENAGNPTPQGRRRHLFQPVGMNCSKVYLGDRDNVEQVIEDLDVNCYDRWAL
jgi:hypothetical protein